ncbi:MAG TPA: hypothetical protein DCP64_00560 [Sarcina sp.]|nr:hypothetical protein [Sarcina sp.]
MYQTFYVDHTVFYSTDSPEDAEAKFDLDFGMFCLVCQKKDYFPDVENGACLRRVLSTQDGIS